MSRGRGSKMLALFVAHPLEYYARMSIRPRCNPDP